MPLSHTDAALVRGWLQGLPIQVLIEAYLPDFEGDGACHLRALLDELALKARRAGRPEWAGWFERRPAGEPAQRRAVEAFERLNRMADIPPQPDHAVELWLPKSLAAACRRRDLACLKDLIDGGWERLPDRSAALVRDWLAGHGFEPEAPAEGQALPGETVAIRPLERLGPPEALDGRRGSNRAPGKPRIAAGNDYEAIQAWLSLWPEDSHTRKAYRREAERFLLWCLVERGKAFSSVGVEDCAAYREFLRDPRPAARWIGPPRPRSAKDWRPFRGPLSERSIQQAVVILGSLCDWLVGQRWLDSNPFAALPRNRGSARMRTDHALTEAQWRFVRDFSRRLAEDAPNPEAKRQAVRLRFALELAYLTGLRLSELAQATLGDIEILERPEGRQHWLTVAGKGGKRRQVPLPESLIAHLLTYLEARGHRIDRLEEAPPAIPLIPGIRRKTVLVEQVFARVEAPVTPLALHRMFRDFFQRAGEALAATDPAAGKRLAEASAHWLRHTHGSHALDRGVPLTVVRDNLGHASIQTTSLYVHKEKDARFAEIGKLAAAPSGKQD